MTTSPNGERHANDVACVLVVSPTELANSSRSSAWYQWRIQP
jgi:hypothetical protein